MANTGKTRAKTAATKSCASAKANTGKSQSKVKGTKSCQ
jgi:hypothetical protein